MSDWQDGAEAMREALAQVWDRWINLPPGEFNAGMEALPYSFSEVIRALPLPVQPAPDTAGGGEETDKPFIDRDHCRQAHGCLGGCRSVREHAAYALRYWSVQVMNEDYAKRQACPSCAPEKPEPPKLPLGHYYSGDDGKLEDRCTLCLGCYVNSYGDHHCSGKRKCGQPRAAHTEPEKP